MRYLPFILLLAMVAGGQTVETCNPSEFTWDPPSDMTGVEEYRFYLAQAPGGQNLNDPVGTFPLNNRVAIFDVGDITPGSTYYAVVTAANTDDQSPPSNEVPF